MPIFRSILCVCALVWVMSSSLWATQNALIVLGMTGSPSITADLAKVSQTVREGLIARGFAPDAIEIMGLPDAGEKVTTALILSRLQSRKTLAAGDEFWLVLLGFAGRNDEGASTFQVSGPRLAAADLKTALDAIPARQFVFIGTSDSGNFIPALLQAHRTVLSATRAEGEIELPRFPEAWANALKEMPQGSWKAIAARASVLNVQTYVASNLAIGEHALLGDPETGQVLEAPFGVDKIAEPEQPSSGDGSMALINAADIKVDIRDPNAEWEKKAPTPETQKLIAEARAVPNPNGYDSIMLEQRLGYSIGEDRSAEDFTLRRIYITKEDGVERWANFMLPQDPPATTTKLEAARIIQPDGSSTVFNPAKMPAGTDPSSSLEEPLSTVFMPNTHAGCLIEIAYRTRHLLDASMPEFSEELPVQLDIPVLKSEVQLQIAPNSKIHFKLRNSTQNPTDTLVNGLRTLTWKMDSLPAFEPLPFDPPERDLTIALDISSLDSWDSFVTWYKRLAHGSDLQDADVKAKAQELAAGAHTRLDKIRRAFEFVSSLRYVAIELGVNGLRPRTPAEVLQNRYGDCKDKANLLIALLSDMGVESNFCVLNRGSSTDVSFPSWQFNHAIAFVPQAPGLGQQEDLWLDTTDSTAPFPTLSPGDVDRAALVFDHDSAKFLTVKALGSDVSQDQSHWRFQEKNASAVNGTLEMKWSGMAEYAVRSEVRGLSPLQRDYVLQKELAKILPNADFTQLSLTPADDLSIPLRLTADVHAAAGATPSPSSSFDVDAYFAPPQRNRPLLINNGQKTYLTQTVDLAYGSDSEMQDPPAFDQRAAGIHATITWTATGNHTLTRTAQLSVDQPLVAQADYPTVRRLLRDWTQHLSH